MGSVRIESVFFLGVIRNRLLSISVIIGLSFLALSGKENVRQEQGNNNFVLSGKVYSREGKPLKNLEVVFYCDNEDPSAKTRTKADGSFKIKTNECQTYLLEVRGELGAGRMYFPAEKVPVRLDITYPITEEIVILHTNDPHFDINNVQELSEKIGEVREEYADVFLFSAGDLFVRHPARWVVNGQLMESPEWYGERAMQMIRTMNDLNYDLLTLGNHELGYIAPYTRLALESANFPLLAANFEITTDELPPVDDYVIFNTTTNRKIAILGLATDNTHREGINEVDLGKTVRKHLHLKDSSDIFIALTHIGLKRDYALAEEFPQFDVIVGGHSHHLIQEAELVNGVLIAQAGGNAHTVSDDSPVYLGQIVITLENGMVKKKRGSVMEIKALVEQE